MSSIIQVENLSKSFTLHHEGAERYTALRDVVATKAKKLFSFPRNLRADVANNSSKEEFWALKDVSFNIEQGDRVGIIGRNGAGKSTLLKILSRITEPTHGSIKIKGRVASLLEVGTGFHPELTGRENIFLNGAILGMSRAEIKKKFDEIVDFAEVEKFLDTPVKRYSSGMYVRLAFAVAAHLEPEVLIIDEVLAVGDAQFQKKCLGKMEDVSKNEGRTVLFVSHNLSVVLSLCTSGVLLNKGILELSDNIASVIQKYNSVGKTSVIEDHHIIKHFLVKQVEDYIRVIFEYEYHEPLDIPHLGIVVKNSLGVPIFGINPSIDNISAGFYETAGKIEIDILYPKLLDGFYTTSVWFGNSKENFVQKEDCCEFEIIGMTSQRQLNTNVVGNVLPVAKWKFYA